MFDFLIPPQVKIGLGTLAIIGAFSFGYYNGNSHAQSTIQKYEASANAKISELEKKNSEISSSVVTKYVDRVNTIKQKQFVYVDQAKNDVQPKQNMSNGWVYLHDQSATNKEADNTKSSDTSDSLIKDNQALAVVVSNYARCNQNSEQLLALQKWITDTKKSIEDSNNKK